MVVKPQTTEKSQMVIIGFNMWFGNFNNLFNKVILGSY